MSGKRVRSSLIDASPGGKAGNTPKRHRSAARADRDEHTALPDIQSAAITTRRRSVRTPTPSPQPASASTRQLRSTPARGNPSDGDVATLAQRRSVGTSKSIIHANPPSEATRAITSTIPTRPLHPHQRKQKEWSDEALALASRQHSQATDNHNSHNGEHDPHTHHSHNTRSHVDDEEVRSGEHAHHDVDHWLRSSHEPDPVDYSLDVLEHHHHHRSQADSQNSTDTVPRGDSPDDRGTSVAASEGSASSEGSIANPFPLDAENLSLDSITMIAGVLVLLFACLFSGTFTALVRTCICVVRCVAVH